MLIVELVAVAGNLTEGSPEAGRTIAGKTNKAGLLIERPANGLANPEGGIGAEFETLAPVELVDRVLKPEVALLDKVKELHRWGERVTASNAHHEAEVGPNKTILGPSSSSNGTLQVSSGIAGIETLLRIAAFLNDLTEFAFLIGGEEGQGS